MEKLNKFYILILVSVLFSTKTFCSEEGQSKLVKETIEIAQAINGLLEFHPNQKDLLNTLRKQLAIRFLQLSESERKIVENETKLNLISQIMEYLYNSISIFVNWPLQLINRPSPLKRIKLIIKIFTQLKEEYPNLAEKYPLEFKQISSSIQILRKKWSKK